MPDNLIQTQQSNRSGPIAVSRRALLGMGLGAAMLPVLGACSSSGSSSSAPPGSGQSNSASGTLAWAWGLPMNWDPVTDSAGYDGVTQALVYDSLTSVDASGNATGWLAETWSANAAGTQFTFKLRPNLKFSDGTPLDATAVAKSINRGRTAKNSVLLAKLASIKDVTAQGATDVVVTMTAPNYQCPLLLSGQTGMIINPAAFATDAAAASLATQPAGSGPFALTSYTPNASAQFARNPHFYLADQIKVANLVLYPQPDPTVVAAATSSGQYNISLLPPSGIDGAKAAGLDVQVIPSPEIYALAFNTSIAPFNNPAVIEAIQYGIDRDKIVAVGQFGVGKASTQPFPPGQPGYNSSVASMYAYDPAKAKQILAQAGLSGGVHGTFTAVAPVSDYPHVELIQGQLAEVGINLNIEALPPAQFNAVAQAGRGRGMIFTAITNRASPVQTLLVLSGKTGLLNVSGLQDPKVNSLLTKISGTPLDDPSYPSLLQQANELIVTGFPYAFLCTSPFALARQSSVPELSWTEFSYGFEGISV
jgi:ABC-type transport system substrate-binding protein